MKLIFSLLLIISFLGAAFFGSMMFDMEFNHIGGCIASSVDRAPCPSDVRGFVDHHLAAIQALSQTSVIPGDWSLIASILALVLLMTPILLKKKFFYSPNFLIRYLEEFELNSVYHQQKLISWLSLFEVSPASI